MEKMNVFNTNDSSNVRPAFGIDLGTTNSAISVIRDGVVPEIIKLDRKRVTLPSCVTWEGENNFVVGLKSYEQRYKNNTIYSVKRLMGSNENVTLEYNGETKVMTPAEVSAEILKELVRQASKEYGEIKDVVITVPAYFNNKQIEATKEAGKLANLNVLSTLREPTSASLLYNMNHENITEEKVLVYDLGGGTFDISLVKITKKIECKELDEFYGFTNTGNEGDDSLGTVLSVVKNEGDMHLGGDDIDLELYNIIAKKLENLGIDINEFTKESQEKLLLKLEGLKKSNKDELYRFKIYVEAKLINGTEIEQDIDIIPQDFIDATKVIYNKTKLLLDNVLNGENIADISSIVLVGGSTKSIVIKQLLSRDFPNIKINDALNPDESVALGAGLQANRLKFGDKNMEVFDILPLAIGILADDTIVKVIRKDQVVPFSATKIFATQNSKQTTVRLSIYQGNSSLKEECTYLGDLVIDNISKNAGDERTAVTVKLSVNSEGLLKCYAYADGKIKEVVLANLFTGENEVKKDLTMHDKKLVRWRRFSKTLQGSEKDVLDKLLIKFETDDTVENEIVKFIKSHKKPRSINSEKVNAFSLD